MRRVFALLRPALAMAAMAATWPAGTQTPAEAVGSRIRLVPQTSERRLEDILPTPDGKRLLTHDRGFAPRLWDRQSMRLLKVLGGSRDVIDVVLLSPDGSRALTLGKEACAIWDTLRARLVLTVPAPRDLPFAKAAAISPDGARIAVGHASGQISLIPLGAPAESVRLSGHTGAVLSLDFSSDGKRLLSGGDDKTARVWDLATRKAPATLTGHDGPVRWASFSPDGAMALTTALDNVARVFSVVDGRKLFEHAHAIGAKGLYPTTLMASLWIGENRRDVLVAGEDGTMSVFDAKSWKLKQTLKGHAGRVREIRFSRDGRRVGTAGDDGTIRMWEVETGKELPFRLPFLVPTAGEFTPDGSGFWMGYEDGTIILHDLASGDWKASALGAVETPLQLGFAGPDRMWIWRADMGCGLWSVASPGDIGLWDTDGRPLASPDGRWALIEWIVNGEQQFHILEARQRKWLWYIRDVEQAAFTSDSKKLVTVEPNGQVGVYAIEEGEVDQSWQFPGKPAITDQDLAGDGVTAATILDGEKVVVWSLADGKWAAQWTLSAGNAEAVALTKDASRVIVASRLGLMALDVKAGGTLWQVDAPADDAWVGIGLAFSPGERTVAVVRSGKTELYDAATGKLIRSFDGDRSEEDDLASQFSADGARFAFDGTLSAEIVDARSGKTLFTLDVVDVLYQVRYSPDGKRILTLDATNGITIWETEPGPGGKGQALGQFLRMRGSRWLVMDAEGRYDAPDPSEVSAASYVIAWEGGLQPVEVSQLKQQFYEPGLLAKLMGADPEPRRPVPDLRGLRLYPEVSLKPTVRDPLKVDIGLTERDGGGIGQVSIYLNGKRVLQRRGAGYFTFDASAYSAYLLPETRLPEGQGNILAVEASNEKGDLTSAPVQLDVGIPPGLKTPDVRLFALCVGAGNYAGTKGDLNAPPADAKALSAAIRAVGERLLPGRVEVATMTTDDKEPLTRARILAWFTGIAGKATSSDVVIVFFAGHGASRIGEQRGYFFLTPEADPTDLNNLSASTTSISGDDLRDALAKAPAQKQVVVLDTCHSGAAASALLGDDRSLSGDYQRAWEAIKDGSGTWLLAGAAADQLSYESANVEHGMLTYALLEAIDRASADGLRAAPSGELFVDVERWLSYAASRVESLKLEVGLTGVQRPELKRAKSGASFDIGVTGPEFRGAIGLKPPRPILLVGNFEQDEEDPANLEDAVRTALVESPSIKPWFEVQKHPNVYRVAGSYVQLGPVLKLRATLQTLDDKMVRKNVETFELEGSAQEVARRLREELETRIAKLEESRKPTPTGPLGGGK